MYILYTIYHHFYVDIFVFITILVNILLPYSAVKILNVYCKKMYIHYTILINKNVKIENLLISKIWDLV